MVDVLESLAKLALTTQEPYSKHEGVHIVRRFPELFGNQVKRLGLVFLLVQHLVGLLEVVIVFSLRFLGVHVAAQGSQQERRQQD